MEIFKYFVGIIGVLILAYVLIVIVRTVLVTGFSTGAEVASNPKVQNAVSSSTGQLATALGGFSLTEWAKGFKPFQFAPIYVGYDNENKPYSFFGNNEGKGFDTQQKLYWQNLGSAPNQHPTDWAPVGTTYAETFFGNNTGENSAGGGEESGEELQPDPNLIKPSVKQGDIVKNNSVITGRAHYKVFSLRVFPIYVLDRDGNTVGKFSAFANGNIGPDQFVNFRAVADLDSVRVPYGFLMFKNENEEMSKLKAVTLVPALFQK